MNNPLNIIFGIYIFAQFVVIGYFIGKVSAEPEKIDEIKQANEWLDDLVNN